MRKRGGSAITAANKTKHQELLAYITEKIYPAISRDPVNNGVNMRLAIVGGAAYRIHMYRSNQSNTLETLDIDMKFFVKNVDIEAKQYRIRCILTVIAQVFQKYPEVKMKAGHRYTYYTFGKDDNYALNISRELLNHAFDYPVDLFMLSVIYSNNGEEVSMVDFSIISREYYEYTYTQFPRYIKAARDAYLFSNEEFVDGVLETNVIEGGFAHYASYDYLVVDTLKMIAMAEQTKVKATDVYKYVNYVLKYIQLMLIRVGENNEARERYMAFLRWLAPLAASFTPEQVGEVHRQVKAYDVIAPFRNSAVVNALTYRGGVQGGGGIDDKDPSPFKKIEGVDANEEKGGMKSGLDTYLATLDEKTINEMIQADIQKAVSIVDAGSGSQKGGGLPKPRPRPRPVKPKAEKGA